MSMVGARRGMRFRLRGAIAAIAASTAALATTAFAFAPPSAAPAAHAAAAISAGAWPGYLHDVAHTSYNKGATSISTTSDIPANLNPVWRWQVPHSPNQGSTNLLASPTVFKGVVYIGAEDGYFYAVSEGKQKVLWSDFLGISLPTTCPGVQGIISTAAVANDPTTGKLTVYVNAPDGYLYALDAATGTVVWKGLVDTPSSTQNDYYSWGSPLVAHGKVYVGISSNCDNPLVRGGLRSFDQSTGAPVATWWALPKGLVGASVWSSPAATGSRIFVTTGNGYNSSGQPLYDQSIVALAPGTLKVLDHWQVASSQQVKDGDFGASPTLFTATINGVATPMVGACNKNGLYYAFKQSDLAAGPVWSTRITEPYPGGAQECDAGAIWNGADLIEGGGAPTTINGTTFAGSVQALDPATGAPVWQTGLDGTVVGSPSEDGGGVVAAPIWQSSTGKLGVYLLNASTGNVITFIPVPKSRLFAQPVFVGKSLLIAAGPFEGLTSYKITTPGPPITGVSPASIGQKTKETLTLTGSGFTPQPKVFVSGYGVYVDSVKVVSKTELKVAVRVLSNATLGPADITVIEGGSPLVADTCTGCLTITPPPAPPAPTSITPNTLVQGAANAAVVMAGTNFESGATVTSHSGVSVQATYASSTELDLTVSVSATLAPGAYNLWVHNPDGRTGECAGCLNVSSATAGPVSAVPAGGTPHLAPTSTTETVRQLVQCGGTMYAVGSFTQIKRYSNIYTRNNIFSFSATAPFKVTSWNPDVNGVVNTIAFNGSNCADAYIGGAFTSVGGVAVHNLAEISTSTGQVVPGFGHNAGSQVETLQVAGAHLLVGGFFKWINGSNADPYMASLNPTTGKDDGFLHLNISGHYQYPNVKTNSTEVYNQQLSHSGTLDLVEGDFTSVAGLPRQQIFMLDVSGQTATVTGWSSPEWDGSKGNLPNGYPYQCSYSHPFYIHAAAWSPNDSTIYVADTGFKAWNWNGTYPVIGLCDAVAAFPATQTEVYHQWINYTGCNSLYSVAAGQYAVYVGGHERWADNPDGCKTKGQGAKDAPGLGGFTSSGSLLLNSGSTAGLYSRSRGHGADDMLVTSAGLWIASDNFGGNTSCGGVSGYAGICFLPYS